MEYEGKIRSAAVAAVYPNEAISAVCDGMVRPGAHCVYLRMHRGVYMLELVSVLNVVASIVIGFVGVVAILYFVYGAFALMGSEGNAARAEVSRHAMAQSLVGAALVLVAFVVVNTLTAVIGESGAGLRTQQVAGLDSARIEAPFLVGVDVSAPGHPARVVVRFSEPVYVTGRVAVSIRDWGVVWCGGPSDCGDRAAEATGSLIFKGDPGRTLESGDVVERMALGSGAAILDIDGNHALYAFPPVIVR